MYGADLTIGITRAKGLIKSAWAHPQGGRHPPRLYARWCTSILSGARTPKGCSPPQKVHHRHLMYPKGCTSTLKDTSSFDVHQGVHEHPNGCTSTPRGTSSSFNKRATSRVQKKPFLIFFSLSSSVILSLELSAGMASNY